MPQPVDEYLKQCEFEYRNAIRPPPEHHWGLCCEEAYPAIARIGGQCQVGEEYYEYELDVPF